MANLEIQDVRISARHLETTGEVALRGVAYRKLLKAMHNTGDEAMQVLAEDGASPWQFVYVASSCTATNWNALKLSPRDTGEILLERFNEWLNKPDPLTKALVKFVEDLEPKIDPTTAPKDYVSDPNA